jgi:hypothetical protein
LPVVSPSGRHQNRCGRPRSCGKQASVAERLLAAAIDQAEVGPMAQLFISLAGIAVGAAIGLTIFVVFQP